MFAPQNQKVDATKSSPNYGFFEYDNKKNIHVWLFQLALAHATSYICFVIISQTVSFNAASQQPPNLAKT